MSLELALEFFNYYHLVSLDQGLSILSQELSRKFLKYQHLMFKKHLKTYLLISECDYELDFNPRSSFKLLH